MINSVEDYRELVLKELFKGKVFSNSWKKWRPELVKLTNDFKDAKKIFELGSELQKIFKTSSDGTRSQASVSGAGAAWEGLVCWYLNIIFAGTTAVAIKQKKALIPTSVSDAATITYANDQTNTESDLLVLVFPNNFSFPKDTLKIRDADSAISLSDMELGIVQCKTNWNDNAQIPMLWDMVYRSSGFKDNNISIGRNGHTISHFKRFTYSFVTVPTIKKELSPSSMSVKRVKGLSGGNYWGRHTKNGVAASLNEIFNRNFKSAFGKKTILGSIQDGIAGGLKKFVPTLDT